MNGLMDSLGISMSMALQHGVPLKDLVRKLAHMRFDGRGDQQPEDPLREVDPRLRPRWLALEFLTEDERPRSGLKAPRKGDPRSRARRGAGRRRPPTRQQ